MAGGKRCVTSVKISIYLSPVLTCDARRSINISIKEAYALVGMAGHNYKHKNIKTVRSSSTYAHRSVAIGKI